MENINTFQGGMNKDISKSLYKEGSYIHAENFTLITDLGLSTGSLRNINGNEEFIELPGCSNVVAITNVVGPTVSITITGNYSYSNVYSAANVEQLGLAMQQDSILATLYYGIAYSDTQVVIYSTLFDNLLQNPNFTVTATNSTVTNIVPAITDPKIMGWGTIRDEIILYTAESSLASPVNELGQIWKLTYDKYSFNPILTLLYNNYLNFSLSHPIPNPGGFVGNFETPDIKKIYWTDNYNRPRVLNIAEPNIMALQPGLLDINSNITPAVATINKIIQGGSIKTGIYQVSARIVNTAGGSSSFITPSNPIPIINESETSQELFEDYEARDTGVTVAKSVQGKIFNLDTTYDRIEPVIIYRENPNATPDIYILPSQNIPSNGNFEFAYTGTETVIPFSLDEFLATGVMFDTVKTMVSKYNMLFFGNVKYSDFDVDFDARAYRFTGDTATTTPKQAILTGSTSYTIDGTAPNWSAIPFTADAIQDIDSQAPSSINNYLFQTNGTTFGGEGPNVKYEFEPMTVVNDNSVNAQYRTLIDNSYNSRIAGPYSFAKFDAGKTVDLNLDTTSLYDQVVQGPAFPNSSSPYIQYGLKGYQRDEMYRFGIVFFSKKEEPSYVHWIADIRIPNVYMPNLTSANPDNRDYLSFPISGLDNNNINGGNPTNTYDTNNAGSDTYYGNNLGVKFTVTLPPSIKELCSSFSIVRMKREDQDKTILGQGIGSPVWFSGTGPSNADRHYTIPNTNYWHTNDTTGQTAGTFYYRDTMFTLASPEFLFKENPAYNTGDQLDLVQVVQASYSATISDGSNTASGGTFRKMYVPFSLAALPRSTDFPLPFSETVSMINDNTGTGYVEYTNLKAWPFVGGQLYNTSWYTSSDNMPNCVGGSRLFIGFDKSVGGPSLDNPALQISGGAYDWTNAIYSLDGITSNILSGGAISNFYIANYRRPGVVQYGGNTYSERSFNEYISTGHIQIIDNPGVSSSYTSMVFGGDTLITLFDYTNQLRNQKAFGNTGTPDMYNQLKNTVLLTAVECTFPVEYRKQTALPAGAVDDGYTTTARCAPNKSRAYADWPRYISGNANAPYTTQEWTENFEVELDYVADNDVVKFFPEPFPSVDQEVFDVRVHRSQTKTNGELTDSWGIFKSEDYIDLDTIQGPLNNLIIHQDRLIGFQDKGVALVSVNERSLTQDVSGSEIILGTGGVLSRYDYISKIIGSRHQFSFVTSHDAVFWFDMNTKNMYKMQGNAPSAITVAKGLSSFTSNNLNGLIQVNDNPYLDKGITSTYDFRYNEAIMTFKDSVVDTSKSVAAKGVTFTAPTTYDFNINPSPIWMSPNTDVLVTVKETGESYPGVVISGGIINIPEAPAIDSTYTVTIYPYTKNSFTVAYNDIIDAFTSFYGYTPSVYINDQVSIFSPADDLKTIYRHDVGPHGVFYNQAPQASKLKLIINQAPAETKVFDNYELVTESIDLSSGANIVDDFFDRIRLYNDYQNTDFQTLPIDNNKTIAKRKERTWNLSNLRNRVLYYDYNAPITPVPSPDIFNPFYLSTTDPSILGDKVFGERMRDKYLLVDLEYDNIENYRFILHTFKTHFRKSAR
jgi:hypothetical protein